MLHISASYCYYYDRVILSLWKWAPNRLFTHSLMIYVRIWSKGGILLTGEERRTPRKASPSATSSTTLATGTILGANRSLRGENSAANHICHI
jgi:hypothetical protein